MIRHGKEDVRYTKLSNGIEIITEKLPYLRSVALAVWFKAGSRFEEASNNGISHFIEHLIFKGTEKLSARDISTKVDEMGGAINAFTSREEISFYLKILDTELEKGVNLISDIVLEPAFRQEDINIERGVILEEIRMIGDSPEESIADFFFENFWTDHPLGRPVQGRAETVSGFSRNRVAEYYNSILEPGSVVIAAAGSLEHDEFLSLTEKRLGTLVTKDPIIKTSPPSQNSFILARSKPNLEQVRIILGREGIPINDKDRYAVMLLSTLLGGSSSSRLFQKVREEKGLVYDISSYSLSFSDSGVFVVSAGARPESIPEVLEIVNSELAELCKKEPSGAELERLKNYVKGNMLMALEGSSARMNRLARHIIYYGRYIPLDEVIARIDSVSTDDIRRTARRLFNGKWSLALMKPETEIKIDESLMTLNE